MSIFLNHINIYIEKSKANNELSYTHTHITTTIQTKLKQ